VQLDRISNKKAERAKRAERAERVKRSYVQ